MKVSFLRAIFFRSYRKRGQSLVEYALIITLISISFILILMGVGDNIKDLFVPVSSSINQVVSNISS
jgi:Flp pilus assembly pilin Flp